METLSDTTVDLELIMLEELMEDDCKCQSNHKYMPKCTKKVVARKFTCAKSFLICENSYRWNLAMMANNELCDGCYRKAAVCWKIIPV